MCCGSCNLRRRSMRSRKIHVAEAPLGLYMNGLMRGVSSEPFAGNLALFLRVVAAKKSLKILLPRRMDTLLWAVPAGLAGFFTVVTALAATSHRLFTPRHARGHRVCGLLYYLWLLAGLADLAHPVRATCSCDFTAPRGHLSRLCECRWTAGVELRGVGRWPGRAWHCCDPHCRIGLRTP